jgi:outer membrane autotransporter protein
VVNGTIAPGNSIGTINVVGPYTQAANSTYTVELNTTTSDLINVTGAATIQGGAGVNVVGAPGFYTLGQRYTILTASGGVTGQYATLTDNLPFVDFTLASDPSNIFLDVARSTVSFQEIAQTPNQRAAAAGAEALGVGNAVFDAAVMLDAPNARRAFDLLSGEIHASVTGTILEDSRFVRDAINGRLRQSVGGPASIFAPQFAALNFGEVENSTVALAFDGGAMAYAATKRKRVRDTMDRALPMKAAPAAAGRVFTTWGQAFGNWGHTRGDGNAASLSRTSGGLITGMDVTASGSLGDIWRAGFAGGYQHTSIDVADRNSSGGVDSYHLAAYGGRQIGALGLRAGAAYSWHDVSTSRNIVFPGFNDATKAQYNANTAQAFGEVGYGVTWRQFALEPFAGLAYVHVHTDSFAETGGAAALAGSGGTTSTTYSTLGLRAAALLPWQNLSNLIAKSSLGWRHAFGTVTPTAQLNFASGTTSFLVAGAPVAREAAAVEMGLEGRVWRNGTFGLAYSGQIASNADDHGVNANFVQRF